MVNILVADSGSTKTNWCFAAENGKIISFTTTGINPYYVSPEEIIEIIKTTKAFTHLLQPNHIFYYGAGCNTNPKKEMVAVALRQVYKTDNILVESDLLGAARALCQNNAGIACILGTGSNSCYYDGKEITSNVSPLGYVLGDEGSGAVIGKKLIADVLKNQLPEEVIRSFYETYQLAASDILDAVYKMPFPNRYLAQFTKFVSAHIHVPELENLVLKSFDEFIFRNLFQYEQFASSEIHFTGSIAFVFEKQLIKSMNERNLHLGKILQNPMENLVAYHLQNKQC